VCVCVCVFTRGGLLVLGVLHGAGGRVAGGPAVLPAPLLGLARGRGRGLRVLRVGVQGGVGVGVLLGHGPRRHWKHTQKAQGVRSRDGY